jgi:Spy/CpxP family protein refolding chaperone
MIKYLIMVLIVLGLAIVIFANKPGSFCGDRGMGMVQGSSQGQWWKNFKAVEELGLTKEQIAKLDDIHTSHTTAVAGLKADVEKKSKELDELLNQDDLDERAILATSDSLISERGELHHSFIKMLLDMRKVLTPEQSKKLNEFRKNMPFHHFGKGMREGFKK